MPACRVCSDLRKAKIVAGALIEGDEESEDAGNAGSWIQLVVLMEEVCVGGVGGERRILDPAIGGGVCV